MASVNVCRLCTKVDKTINLFSRAGMRNERSSRITAMLDITIEDDERVSPYVCYKCTRRLSIFRGGSRSSWLGGQRDGTHKHTQNICFIKPHSCLYWGGQSPPLPPPPMEPSLLEKAIEDRKAFRELAISSMQENQGQVQILACHLTQLN